MLSQAMASGLGRTSPTRWTQWRLSFLFWSLLLSFPSLSVQLPPGHPLAVKVSKLNRRGPFVAVVMAYQDELDALRESGEFISNADVALYGRKFEVGRIRGVDVVCVMTGQRRLNAGITVQILLDNFIVRGIVHYGTAGSSNDTLSFGDVSVPKLLAFTGSWEWTKNQSKEEKRPQLIIGNYNVPNKGLNKLSTMVFKPEEFFSAGKPMEEVFWMETDSAWYERALQLKDLKLLQCVNETFCLPNEPRLEFGLRGSTADIFLDNASFRLFLFQEFGVSTIDEESAAIIMTAKSVGIPVLVFRAVADLAGGDSNWSSTSLSSIASKNALKVAIEFIAIIKKNKGAYDI